MSQLSAHALGWNGSVGRVYMPTATDGLNSQPFAVPRGARCMTIWVPALVGSASTVKLQTLTPDDEGASETWSDIQCFNLADGSVITLDELAEGTVITLPITATGGGIFRFVASTAQTGAANAITIKVLFHLAD